MTVQEFRDKLELVDGECEVLLIDGNYQIKDIKTIGLDCYFDNAVTNDKSPFTIRF